MKLIIVESPHKASTISKYLGKEFTVMASAGHVRDLPEKKTGVDILNNFKPVYEIKADKVTVINKIKHEIERADAVYVAGDPDREGEAISWHVAEVCGIKEKKCRIEFNEISASAVKRALTMPREINMELVDAQQARRVLDRLVGYELSPILSKKIHSGLSAGRVQSVALKMVVDKEREIRNFKPEEYWNISAFIAKDNLEKSYKCDFVELDSKKFKVKTKEVADNVIEQSKLGEWSIANVKRAKSLSKAPAPFTTSSMQQDAINKLGFSAAMVSKLAQSLYEGVDIKGLGQTALVTYIRTDSVRISEEAQQNALGYIAREYGKDFVPKKPNIYATKAGAQDAHEAIRPISIDLVPADLMDKMPRNEYRLYKLIYDRFLASQMAPAEYDTLNVSVVSTRPDHVYGYNLKGKTCTFKGYTAVYSNSDEKEESKSLPNFEVGNAISLKDIKGEQKFTKPPQRYNDGTFIKAMEDNGIGRPATFTKIVGVLDLRKYIERQEKFIVPTELGEIVCDQLVKDFPSIMDTKFTAQMEADLDRIANGEVKWYDVLKGFYPDFHKKVLEVKFDGTKVKQTVIESDVVCEKCGAKMVVKQGRFGQFLACPNYPKCSNTKPMDSPVAKCPKCGKDVFKRMSKKGKPFYGCSGYPNCDFISWDIPAPILCPKCNSTMRLYKNNTNGTVKYICTNHDCKNVVIPETPAQNASNQNNEMLPPQEN